jgi:hypothetical protein
MAAAVPWVVFAARGVYASDDAPEWLLRMAWYGGGLAALELLRLFWSRTVLDHVPAIAVAASYVAAWSVVTGGLCPGLLTP